MLRFPVRDGCCVWASERLAGSVAFKGDFPQFAVGLDCPSLLLAPASARTSGPNLLSLQWWRERSVTRSLRGRGMTEPTRGVTTAHREIIEALVTSRKYAALCEDTLSWAATWALERASGRRAAVKLAKRKLHQIFGACEPRAFRRRATQFLEGLPSPDDVEGLRKHVLRLLESHPSTKERLPILGTLYHRIFSVTGVPQRVLDVACGLHPLEIPWMGLGRDTEYTALDIDRRQVDLVNSFLSHLGMKLLGQWWDVLARVPPWPVDVTFALKILPCLERRARGAGSAIVNSLASGWVVVSFPSRSLGGRKRLMGLNYANQMRETARREGWQVSELIYTQEVFFIIRKG
jgi:16S rRNA (guanine(1405)-N(7))-methyltransferase